MANIVAGVAAGAKQNGVNFEYNAAEQIFSSTNGVVVNDLVKVIKDQEHLLFLFNTVYNEVQMRFGLYAHKGYTQYQSNGGNEDVPIEAGIAYIYCRWVAIFDHIQRQRRDHFPLSNFKLQFVSLVPKQPKTYSRTIFYCRNR